MSRYEPLLESVDAAVFTGELIHVDEHRQVFKEYLSRWNLAISQHEEVEKQANDDDIVDAEFSPDQNKQNLTSE